MIVEVPQLRQATERRPAPQLMKNNQNIGKAKENHDIRSSTLQSSSWAPLGRPRAIDNRRSSEYTHHHTRRRISLSNAERRDLLDER